MDRRINPEKDLILQYIHEIVIQSPFQCGNCNFYFTQRSQFLEHFMMNHSKAENKFSKHENISHGWSCSACLGVIATDLDSLIEHLEGDSHMKIETAIGKSIPIIIREFMLQACPLCSKQFKLSRQLFSHAKREHQVILYPKDGTGSGQVNGEILKTTRTRCKSTSDEDLGTRAHKAATTRSVEDPITCVECPVRFTTEHSLSRRCSHSHSRPSEYKCGECKFSSSRRSHYIRHSKTHDATLEKPSKCETCGASFREKYALNYHKKTHGKKNFKCDFSGCNYIGRSKSDVTDHSVTHQAEYLHACDLCEYCTKSRRHLIRHVKLCHSEASAIRYSCQFCPYKAKLKDGLKRHEQIHLNEQSFSCPYCEFKTSHLELIRSHIRNRHPGKFLYACGACMKDMTTVFHTNSYNEFQTHLTQKHSEHDYGNSKIGLLVVAGLKQSSKGIDLPEFPTDDAAQRTLKGKREQGTATRTKGDYIFPKIIKTSAEGCMVSVSTSTTLLHSESLLEFSFGSSISTETSDQFDSEATLLSSLILPDISADIDDAPVFYADLIPIPNPTESESFFDVSTFLLSSGNENPGSTVEDTEVILEGVSK